MAPKSAAPAPKSAAPAASGSSYNSSGSGEEDAEVTSPQKKPAAAAAPKPSSKAPIEEDSSTGDYSSSDESASDSGAAAKPPPPAKPLPSRPPATAAASNKKKRKEAPPPPPEDNNENGGVDGQKLKRFQRLWSEADEIAILRGMLNYQAKTGALPSNTNMTTFRDSIRKSLTMDISVRQLADKVRRLRSKYGKNLLTASSGKPNNSAVHELSHKIWGANNDAGSARKSGKAKEVEENDDSAKVKPRYTFLKHAVTRMGDCLPCSVTLEEVLDFVDHSKAMAIEENLKKLWKLQLKNRAREREINKETNLVLMEALEKMG